MGKFKVDKKDAVKGKRDINPKPRFGNTGVDLGPETFERLVNYCQKKGLTRSRVIRQMVEKCLNDLGA